jgi:hypothetical protein
MKIMKLACSLGLLASALYGCDGQQYVGPNTALLTITDDSTGSEVVTACHYIPVLLGSRVEKTYVVDDLEASLSLTRTDVVVTFQGSGEGTEPFRATVAEIEASGLRAANPPLGYDVELGSGCAPD